MSNIKPSTDYFTPPAPPNPSQVDLTKPHTTVCVYPCGKVAFTTYDAETLPSISGNYLAMAVQLQEQYYLHLDPVINENQLQGWMIKQSWYQPIMPENSQIFLLFGSVDFQSGTISGDLQRFTWQGSMIGQYAFQGIYSPNIEIELPDTKDQLSVQQRITGVLSKPQFGGA